MKKLVPVMIIVVSMLLSCGKENPSTNADKINADTGNQAGVGALLDENTKTMANKGGSYLLGQYGKRWGKGLPMRFIGLEALIASSLMMSPAPTKPTDPKIREVIDFIITQQQANGSWATPRFGQAVYESSCCIMALVAAAKLDDALAKNEKLVAALRKGADYMLLIQIDELGGEVPGNMVVEKPDSTLDGMNYGGWGYGSTKHDKMGNMSVTSYAVDSLLNLKNFFRDDKKLSKRIDASAGKLVNFLENCQNTGEKSVEVTDYESSASPQKIKVKYGNDGGAIYMPGVAKNYVTLEGGIKVPISYGSMTFALLKGYIFAGLEKSDPRVKAAMGWLTDAKNFTFERHPGFPSADGQDFQGYYYYLHSASRALAIWGENVIVDSKGQKHDWRLEIIKVLKDSQREKGCWYNDKNPRWQESYDPNNRRSIGDILSTAYALLALGYSLN